MKSFYHLKTDVKLIAAFVMIAAILALDGIRTNEHE